MRDNVTLAVVAAFADAATDAVTRTSALPTLATLATKAARITMTATTTKTKPAVFSLGRRRHKCRLTPEHKRCSRDNKRA